jgi:hypothetical protein
MRERTALVVLGACVTVPLLAAITGGLIAGSLPCSNGSAVPYAVGLVAWWAAGVWWSVRNARGLFAAAAAVGSVLLSTGALLFSAFAVGFDRCFVF